MKRLNIIGKAVLLCLVVAICISIGFFGYADSVESEKGDVTTPRGLQNFEIQNTYTNQFADVSSSAWYIDNVKVAYELDLVKGTSSTSFNPSGHLSIAEAITLAARIDNIYYAFGKDFTQTSTWYQVYVDYAIERGVITSNQFTDYTKMATRADFAQIFANALPTEALEIVNWVENDCIPDVKTSASYGSAVYLLYRAGILTGSDDLGTFNPSNSITRAEVSAIVTRMVDIGLRKTITLTV